MLGGNGHDVAVRLPGRSRRTPPATVEQARAALDAAIAGGSAADIAEREVELGIALGRAGDTTGERAAYERAIALGDPDQSVRARRNIALIVLDVDTESGLSAMRAVAAERHPRFSRLAILDVARVLTQNDRADEALAALEPFAQWEPGAEEAELHLLIIARLNVLRGNDEAARPVLEELLLRDDRYGSQVALTELIGIFQRRDDAVGAKRVLRAALRHQRRLGAGDEYQARLLMDLGALALGWEQYERARRLLDRARHLGNVRVKGLATFHLGRSFLVEAENMLAPTRQRKLATYALAHLMAARDALLENGPPEDLSWLYLCVGSAEGLLGNVDAARAWFLQSIDAALPEDRAVRMYQYAEFLARHRRNDDAREILVQLIEAAPERIAEPSRKLIGRLR